MAREVKIKTQSDRVYNLWEHDLASDKDVQRTSFKTDSVVFPAISRDGGTIVFRHQFDLYRWSPGGGEPVKIEIQCASDGLESPVERTVLDRATGITFTQDGLQMAFIAGGDVWVMDTELREPRQVTHTAEEERGVVFAPDGKSLWFISDAGGQTDVWKAVPAKPAKFWWENTEFTLTRVTNDAAVESHLQFTRDGKRVAYNKGGDLWLSDADGQNAKRLIESWDAPSFQFSPDGAWVVYSLKDEWFNNDVWLMPLDGARAPFNLSRHPNNDEAPAWSPDGKMIAWTGRHEDEEMDIYYVWLSAEDDERTKRERTVVKAREKITKAASGVSTSGSRPAVVPKKDPEPKPADQATEPPAKPEEKSPADKPAPTTAEKPKPLVVRVDLDDIHERIHRIAVPKSTESALVWSPDSKKLAYVATTDGKRGTYTLDFPDALKPVLLAPAAGSDARWIKQDDQIVCLIEGQPGAISAKGTVTTHRFRAQQSVVRAEKQRAVFDQCWRTMRDRYYDVHLGNRDWDAIRAKYSAVAAAAPDMRAVVEVVPLMLGELNGSHLGFTLEAATPAAATWRDETAHLGLRFDSAFAGPG